VEYLNSELVAQNVIDTLQLDMLASDLLPKVTIAPDTLRLFIQIDVDLEDGEMANRIASEWGNELIRFRDVDNARLRREDQVLARIQDVPRYSLYQPRPLINAAAGGVLGLLLGAVIVFIMEYLESAIVRRRDDLERVLEIPVLAAIPDVER
jgi:capsular polysaccharide biosynthesis protein